MSDGNNAANNDAYAFHSGFVAANRSAVQHFRQFFQCIHVAGRHWRMAHCSGQSIGQLGFSNPLRCMEPDNIMIKFNGFPADLQLIYMIPIGTRYSETEKSVHTFAVGSGIRAGFDQLLKCRPALLCKVSLAVHREIRCSN